MKAEEVEDQPGEPDAAGAPRGGAQHGTPEEFFECQGEEQSTGAAGWTASQAARRRAKQAAQKAQKAQKAKREADEQKAKQGAMDAWLHRGRTFRQLRRGVMKSLGKQADGK